MSGKQQLLARVVIRLAAGERVVDIAADQGVTARTIRNWLAGAGLPSPLEIRQAARQAHLNDRAWLAERVESGLPVGKIADDLGLARTEVLAALQRHDIPVPDGPVRVVNDYLSEPALRDAVAQGRSMRDIARQAGVTHHTIARRCVEYGISLDSRPPRATRPVLLDDVDWLRQQAATSSMSAIARSLGCSQATVRAAMARFGLTARTTSVKYHELGDPDWLRARYWADSLTMFDIAQLVGCHRNAVWAAFQRHGIDTRRGAISWTVDASWLSEQYDTRTIAAIAAQQQVGRDVVRAALIYHGIERRRGGRLVQSRASRDKLADRDWLIEQYRTRALADIAAELDVGTSTVRNSLIRHNIDRRRTGGLAADRIKHRDLANRDWLIERYATASITAIAAELGVSTSPVRRALVIHRIKLRRRRAGSRPSS